MRGYLVTFFGIGVTVLAYLVSRQVFLRSRSALLNPVFLSTLMVMGALLCTHVSFAQYANAKGIMTFPLGPATVALALPLYRKRKELRAMLGPVVLGVTLGSVCTSCTALLIARLGGLERSIVVSMGPKSVTAPIAVEISKIAGGDAALTVAFVIATGIIGCVLGPGFMTLLRIKDPVARGLAMGTTSHGQGTAIILGEGETQGAMAGIAMALAAILTSFVAPTLIRWLAPR